MRKGGLGCLVALRGQLYKDSVALLGLMKRIEDRDGDLGGPRTWREDVLGDEPDVGARLDVVLVAECLDSACHPTPGFDVYAAS